MVIVKNMDIPDSCRDCDFAKGEYLDVSWEKGYCGLGGGSFNRKSNVQRLKTCPLKEVVYNHFFPDKVLYEIKED